LAKKERANERFAMMKEDLRKAAQERSELLEKLQWKKGGRQPNGSETADREKASLMEGWLGQVRCSGSATLEEVFVISEDKVDLG
jgi:hypothetical protein